MPENAAATEILTHQIDILRIAAGLRADAITELEALESHLLTALQNKDFSVNKAARLEALLKQTQGQISDAYAKIGKGHDGNLRALAKLEGKQAAKIVDAQIGASVVSVAIAPKLLEAVVDEGIVFGHTSGTWWKSQAEDLRQKFAGNMRQGILLGESIDELARRVRGTKDKGYTDGIMAAKKREAEALVRSSVIATSNEARLRAFAEMDDVIKGIAWLATLDGRTTPICRALDGLAWTLKDYQPVGHDKKFPGATAHWNCRSTQITVLKSWDELSGKKLPTIGDDELEAAMREELKAAGWSPEKVNQAIAGSRASMDGQVPAKLDYNEWLKTKDDAFIDRVLGPGRAALWKSGQVSIRDLTDQDNRPLTLKQLADKIEKGIPAPETLGVQWEPAAKAAPFEEPAEPPIKKATPEEIAATAALATQAASKTWGDLAKAVMAEMPDASPVAQLAAFEAKKLAKQQATMLNDTAAMNVAKGWMPPVTKTMLNKLAADDPVKLAFFDKVKLAKAKLDAESGEAEAQKQLDSFKATSPEHDLTVGLVQQPGMKASEVLAAATEKLNGDANKLLHKLAAKAAVPPPAQLPLGLPPKSAAETDAFQKKLKPIDPNESPEFDWVDPQELAKMVQNPLKNIDYGEPLHDVILNKTPGVDSMEKLIDKVAEVKAVKIDKLIVSQTWLDKAKIATALGQQYNPNINRPTAILHEGSLLLIDGNHRVVAEHFKGAKEITINVIDTKYLSDTGNIIEPLPDKKKPPAKAPVDGDSLEALAAKALLKNPAAGYAEYVAVKDAAAKAAANKWIDEFAAKSPLHKEAAEFVKNMSEDAGIPVDAASLQNQLDFFANEKLNELAAGGKGVSLIAKAKAASMLKSAPDAGYDALQIVEATVAASIEAASKTAAVNGAIKASIAGKKLNAKQQAAVDAMTPTEKADYDAAVAAGKNSTASVAAAVIAVAPDAKLQNLAQDVPNVAGMTFVKTLPGSTSPGLYTDDTSGKQWVVKKASGTSLAHVQNEALADAIYRAAGARVPFSAITSDGKATVKVAEFIPDGKTIGEALKVKADTDAIKAAAQNHFVLDALLGNWDAVGTGKNNMLVDRDGNLWRIDNGGALLFRAMGDTKDPKWLTPEVQELKTLLNPALNSDAASVYHGITTDEIHRQIREIIDRRDAILDAAEANPVVRDLLKERIGYLETLLPAALKATKNTAPAPVAAVPLNIAARVAKARTAGVPIQIGSNQVEDNNVLAWAERDLSGKLGMRLQMKLTQAGSDAVMEKLRKANVVAQTTTGGQHYPDSDWPTIEMMAKHLGFHAGKGTLNPTKFDQLAALRTKYQTAAKSKDPVEAAKGAYYTKVLNDLVDAKITNAKPSKIWKSFNQLIDTDPAYAQFMPAQSGAKPTANELASWSIKRLDRWDSYRTEIGKDGIAERIALPNPEVPVGEGYEMTKGSVRVRFTPQQPLLGAHYSVMRAMFGTVQVWVDGTPADTGTAQAMAALKEIGIDTDPPTNDQLELTYLHKGWYQHNKHTEPAYSAIYNDASLPIEEKVKRIRALSEKEFGVKLPKSPAEWNADYDPRGFNDASDGTGYRVYYRWDVPRSKMEKELKGYTLNHFSAYMLEAVKGWLAAGRVTPTYDRMRTGVEVRPGLGMSPLEDMVTGGAMGFFNCVTNTKTNSGVGAGFRWKIRNLARLDSVNLGTDQFGRFEAYKDRQTALSTYKGWKRLTRKDQAMLKNGLSFVDEIEHIWADDAQQRQAIIDEFKKAGYATLPDGRKIEAVVSTI